MSVVDHHTLQAVFMVMTFTGLRLKEVKGLRWEDYDAETLNVQRAVVQGKITETKGSKAPVPVVGLVKKYLKSHLKRNSGDGYIFHAASNSQKPIIFEHIVWDVVIPATKKAGIEWHGIHAFRRGLASVSHDLNISKLTISHILRHSTKSSKSVAAKHYIKPSLKLMREALEKVEAKYKMLEKKRGRL